MAKKDYGGFGIELFVEDCWHIKDKVYFCPWCGEQYLSKNNMEHHLIVCSKRQEWLNTPIKKEKKPDPNVIFNGTFNEFYTLLGKCGDYNTRRIIEKAIMKHFLVKWDDKVTKENLAKFKILF